MGSIPHPAISCKIRGSFCSCKQIVAGNAVLHGYRQFNCPNLAPLLLKLSDSLLASFLNKTISILKASLNHTHLHPSDVFLNKGMKRLFLYVCRCCISLVMA